MHNSDHIDNLTPEARKGLEEATKELLNPGGGWARAEKAEAQWNDFVSLMEQELDHWEKPGATGGLLFPPVSEDTRRWLALHTQQVLDVIKIFRNQK